MKKSLSYFLWCSFVGFCVFSGVRLADYVWPKPAAYLLVCFKNFDNVDDCELMEFVPDEKQI